MFAALGDPTRLAIAQRLSDGSALSIAALTEGSGLTRQAVTKHLRVLEDAEIVRAVRAGRERLYALRGEAIDEARAALDRVARDWEEALGRLRRFVEEGDGGASG